MYGVQVSLIPTVGTYQEKSCLVSTKEIGLSDDFIQGLVKVSFELSRIEEKFLCKAEAKCKILLECARCLKTFEREIVCNFVVEFEPKPFEEIAEPEVGVSFFSDNMLPLGEEIRQELELAVPRTALCSEECRGFCPQCGIDLNTEKCSCSQAFPNRPFGNLGELLKKHPVE
jgi:uncharacterized protein